MIPPHGFRVVVGLPMQGVSPPLTSTPGPPPGSPPPTPRSPPMFDCAPTTHTYLSHDMPCGRCGHGRHTYLACSETCPCPPTAPPTRVVRRDARHG